jgi:hypothetical protein
MSKIRTTVASASVFGLLLSGVLVLGGCGESSTPAPANPSNPSGLTDEMLKQKQANEENAKTKAKK